MKLINNTTNRILYKLGKSNDSEIATASIAAFKLFFIPMAALGDKKSTNEQKKYVIKRDIITETAALLSYIGITRVIKNNLTSPVCKKYYKDKAKKLVKNRKLDISSDDFKILTNIDGKALKNYAVSDLAQNGNLLTKEQSKHIKSLENVVLKFKDYLQSPKDLYLNTKKSISHICVCTLALSLIPFMTNKILEALGKANALKKTKTQETFKIPDINEYFAKISRKEKNVPGS